MPLNVVVGYAKTEATARNIAEFGSNDALGTADLGLTIKMIGSATAENRAMALDSYENSAGARALILQSGGGNVGIGETLPTYLLQLKTGADNSQNAMAIRNSSATLLLDAVTDSSANMTVNVRNASGTAKVLLHTAGASYFTGGNVGIGATAPNMPLNVVVGYASSDTTVRNVAEFSSNDTLGSADLGLFVRMHGSATAGARGMGLQAYENSGGTRHLILQDLGGNVGIGTTAPGDLLHVNGYVRATGEVSSQGDPALPSDTFVTTGLRFTYDGKVWEIRTRIEAAASIGEYSVYDKGLFVVRVA
jgi:hypothetical protein